MGQKELNPTSVSAQSPAPPRIPKAVVKRLSLYSRVLQDLESRGVEKASSRELAAALGFNSAQVRKDLAYFGQFGVPGMGYYVQDLRARIKRILRTDREVRVALVGVGNLGSALLSYGGFPRQNFRIVVAFDSDPHKWRGAATGPPILDVASLETELPARAVDIVMLATPAEAAQDVCDRVARSGIRAILNFVPARLASAPDVAIHDVDLAIEMEVLAFHLH